MKTFKLPNKPHIRSSNSKTCGVGTGMHTQWQTRKYRKNGIRVKGYVFNDKWEVLQFLGNGGLLSSKEQVTISGIKHGLNPGSSNGKVTGFTANGMVVQSTFSKDVWFPILRSLVK